LHWTEHACEGPTRNSAALRTFHAEHRQRLGDAGKSAVDAKLKDRML